MNTDRSVLAGKLDDVGEAWINMFHRWGDLGLQAGLTCLVFITMVQKVSVRAGIGALLLMIVALGLYNSREDLANMFEDEVKNPAQGAPAVPGIISPPLAAPHGHTLSAGSGL
ncbi:hypothetical protein [Streptomyces sp. NPDC057280]|uniref:hypothetical protein n=1 Tax=Streptomyces sp. NPDC057280 TaxID=3346081 RepID=UPI00362847E7